MEKAEQLEGDKNIKNRRTSPRTAKALIHQKTYLNSSQTITSRNLKLAKTCKELV